MYLCNVGLTHFQLTWEHLEQINHINWGACCIYKQVIDNMTVSYCIKQTAIYNMFWLKQSPAKIKSSKNTSFEDSVVKKKSTQLKVLLNFASKKK